MIVTFLNDDKREAFNYDNVLDLFVGTTHVMLTKRGTDGKIYKLAVLNNEFNQMIIGGFENDSDRKED